MYKANVWLKFILIYFLLTILLFGIFNYIVDPFYQYRVNRYYQVSFVSKLERYTNPGFAKNFDYNSIILGSSTSENFIISNVKNILGFKKPIKFCISGTSAYEESLILETALQNKKINHVLYGLDTFVFWGRPKRIRHKKNTFPFFLYDKNIINDYKYIFSIDTIVKSIKTLWNSLEKNKNNIKYDYNKMYQWQHNVPSAYFTKEHVLKEWRDREKSDLAYQPNNKFYFYKNSFDYNFLRLIKKYPLTNFIIYFPPYSILEYKYEKEKKVFIERLKLKKYITFATKDLRNVKVYDFQIAKEITHNLENYHDLNHFHQKINRWILKQIKENNYRLTQNNIDKYIKELKKQVDTYKLEKIK